MGNIRREAYPAERSAMLDDDVQTPPCASRANTSIEDRSAVFYWGIALVQGLEASESVLRCGTSCVTPTPREDGLAFPKLNPGWHMTDALAKRLLSGCCLYNESRPLITSSDLPSRNPRPTAVTTNNHTNDLHAPSKTIALQSPSWTPRDLPRTRPPAVLAAV